MNNYENNFTCGPTNIYAIVPTNAAKKLLYCFAKIVTQGFYTVLTGLQNSLNSNIHTQTKHFLQLHYWPNIHPNHQQVVFWLSEHVTDFPTLFFFHVVSMTVDPHLQVWHKKTEIFTYIHPWHMDQSTGSWQTCTDVQSLSKMCNGYKKFGLCFM